MSLRGALMLAHAFRTVLPMALQPETWRRTGLLKGNDLTPDRPHHRLIPSVDLEPCHA